MRSVHQIPNIQAIIPPTTVSTTYVRAFTHIPSRIMRIGCRLNAENVVNPPSSPVMAKRDHRSEIPVWENTDHRIPISRQPEIFVTIVLLNDWLKKATCSMA